MLEVPIDRVRPNPQQPRHTFGDDALNELAASIRAQGVIQPLIVRQVGDDYELIAGERRWRAARVAGLTQVPVVARAAGEADMLRLALVENIQREELNPVDRATAYRRLIDEFGISQEDLARSVGCSRTAISNTLRLLRLPPEILARIASGHLSEGHGRALLSVPNESERHMIWRRIERDGLSVRETEELVRRAGERPRATEPRASRRAGPPPELAPFLAELEDRIRTALGTDAEIAHARTGGGVIRIRYYDAEDLERVVALLTRGQSRPPEPAPQPPTEA
jgi:ParB family chromosome partitioning protein